MKINFFPFPVFFGLTKKNYLKIKNCSQIDLIYKNQKIAVVNKLKFYSLNKNYFGKKIFGKKFKKHPFYKKFKKRKLQIY